MGLATDRFTGTSMHTRLMMGQGQSPRTRLEARHCANAAALFRKALSDPKSHTSALWMASVMVSFADSFSVDDTSERSLFSTTWLRVHNGVRTIFDMLPPASPFRIVDGEFTGGRCLGMAPVGPGCEGVSESLAEPYGIDYNSSRENNIYHAAVHTLSQLEVEEVRCPLRFLAFVNVLSPKFLNLLESRDHRALYLLMRWYALVPPSAWWLETRAQLGRHAIAAYLGQETVSNMEHQALVS